MRDYLRLIIVLAVISALAGGALAVVNTFTEPKIQALKIQTESDAYQQALAVADVFEDDPEAFGQTKTSPELTLIQSVKAGLKDGVVVGWVCKVVTSGYGGNIDMLVGIENDGQMGKVTILGHTETPGLGSHITDDEFIGQAAIDNATAVQTLQVGKDGGTVQAITGATVSSRAVLRGINQVFWLHRRLSGQETTKTVDAVSDASM